jgi:hypothetical protein
VCLSKAFNNLNAQKKGIFIITEKPRVVFAKCNWIGSNSKISEGWFCKHIFLTLSPIKNNNKYVFIQKFHLKCVC